jgi:hypothetical protein
LSQNKGFVSVVSTLFNIAGVIAAIVAFGLIMSCAYDHVYRAGYKDAVVDLQPRIDGLKDDLEVVNIALNTMAYWAINDRNDSDVHKVSSLKVVRCTVSTDGTYRFYFSDEYPSSCANPEEIAFWNVVYQHDGGKTVTRK